MPTFLRKGREKDYQREYMRQYRKDEIKKREEQKRDRLRKKNLKPFDENLFNQRVMLIKREAEIINRVLKIA